MIDTANKKMMMLAVFSTIYFAHISYGLNMDELGINMAELGEAMKEIQSVMNMFGGADGSCGKKCSPGGF